MGAYSGPSKRCSARDMHPAEIEERDAVLRQGDRRSRDHLPGDLGLRVRADQPVLRGDERRGEEPNTERAGSPAEAQLASACSRPRMRARRRTTCSRRGGRAARVPLGSSPGGIAACRSIDVLHLGLARQLDRAADKSSANQRACSSANGGIAPKPGRTKPMKPRLGTDSGDEGMEVARASRQGSDRGTAASSRSPCRE